MDIGIHRGLGFTMPSARKLRCPGGRFLCLLAGSRQRGYDDFEENEPNDILRSVLASYSFPFLDCGCPPLI
jgi:hypothetical protein